MIDEKDVVFVWSENDRGLVMEVVATTRDGVFNDGDRYPNARGACDLGWMEDPRHTPQALFMGLLESGFADRHWFEAAVIEFARVDECEWARKLAAILRAS